VFVEEAWPIVVPAEPFQPNWHIDTICDHLMYLYAREFWNLLINIPPRFGKSTISTVMFPAWVWIQDPTMRTISASYAQSLSTRDSLATRRLLESNWYRSRWGDRFRITSDQNEKMRFENDRKGFRLATSVGGMATGEGSDLQIVDDPHNVTESESDLVREGVNTWYNVTMSTRTGRGGKALRLVIMQRVHENDLSANILEQGGYTHLNLPMEYEPSATKPGWRGWTDPRTEPGQLIWPSRFDAPKVAELQLRMGSYAYAGQYQQRPAPAEGGMFQRKWWRWYSTMPDISRADDTCWSWDMAFKDLDDSDFVAGTAWARFGGDFYLLPHCVHDRIGFSASLMAVKGCRLRYPGIRKILVEDKANGTAIMDALKHEVPGLIAVEPEGGKESRAWRIQPVIEAGNVYLPEPQLAPWIEQYVLEHSVFPNGANDDWVDSTSQALNRLLNDAGRGFFVPSKSISMRPSQERVETYRDPRESDQPIPVGYSERGDMRRSLVSHRRV
jgi:predicted phage terminase large subunit-like protein